MGEGFQEHGCAVVVDAALESLCSPFSVADTEIDGTNAALLVRDLVPWSCQSDCALFRREQERDLMPIHV